MIIGRDAEEEVPPFTIEELLTAADRLKSGKAPELDGIPPEAVKTAARMAPEWMLRVRNCGISYITGCGSRSGGERIRRDLALIVTAQEKEDLMQRVETSAERIENWLREHRLELATEKTEAVILRGPRPSQ
ncbi:hypothetical protein JTB14_027534 [Gonioctena quinquepunctata]|nr:hypothetical protein JTB14_027534 [Gonioctena quinquepunctata]